MDDDGSPSGRERSRSGTRRCWTPSSGCARARSATRSLPPPKPDFARAADDLLREEPQGGRADPPLHRRTRRHRDRQPGSRPPRRYTAEQRRESSGASSRASSSATATDAELGIDIGLLDCAISVGFPEPSRCWRQQGRAGGASAGSRSSLRQTTRSTSSSRASLTRFSHGGSRRRSSTTPTEDPSTRTVPLGERGADSRREGLRDARQRGAASRRLAARARAHAGGIRLEGPRLPAAAYRCAPATRRRSPSSRARPGPSSGWSSATARN